MNHDYTLKVTTPAGKIVELGYQALLLKLGIEKEIVEGAPLSEGGTPQVATLSRMLQRAWKLTNPIQVFFNGSQIL